MPSLVVCGMMMDIDRLSSTSVDKSNQKDNLIAFAPLIWLYLSILLIFLGILLVGCGLANYSQDGIYADWASFAIGAILGAFGLIASGGVAIALYLGGLIISGSLIGLRFCTACVEA